MPDITSDTYEKITDANGASANYDVINLKPGQLYLVVVDDDETGTYGTATIDLQVLTPQGDWKDLDDADSQGIDGTGVTEFRVYALHTAIRFKASSVDATTSVDYSVVPAA